MTLLWMSLTGLYLYRSQPSEHPLSRLLIRHVLRISLGINPRGLSIPTLLDPPPPPPPHPPFLI